MKVFRKGSQFIADPYTSYYYMFKLEISIIARPSKYKGERVETFEPSSTEMAVAIEEGRRPSSWWDRADSCRRRTCQRRTRDCRRAVYILRSNVLFLYYYEQVSRSVRRLFPFRCETTCSSRQAMCSLPHRQSSTRFSRRRETTLRHEVSVHRPTIKNSHTEPRYTRRAEGRQPSTSVRVKERRSTLRPAEWMNKL